MQELVLKMIVALATKLLTESFLAKLLVHTLDAWAKTSETDWDDKVVKAMADALGVPLEKLKEVCK